VECSEYDPRLNLPRVSIDNYAAAREAMAHLIWLGHEKIGLVSSENRLHLHGAAPSGLSDALQKANLPLREDYVSAAAPNDYSFKSDSIRPEPSGAARSAHGAFVHFRHSGAGRHRQREGNGASRAGGRDGGGL
jgi:hypothetical protein